MSSIIGLLMPIKAIKKQKISKSRVVKKKVVIPSIVKKSVLIIECDHLQLERDSLLIGNFFEKQLSSILPKDSYALLQTTTEQQLCRDFGEKFANTNFEVIVVIGHSSTSGIKLTSESSISWAILGDWLEPFRPKKLILIACEGARSLPAKALFERITSLDELFGSPAKINIREAIPLFFLIPFKLSGYKIDKNLEGAFCILNLLANRGILLKKTRKKVKVSKTELEKYELFEKLILGLQPFIRKYTFK